MIVVDLRRIWSSIHHDHEKQDYCGRFFVMTGAGGTSGTSGTARMMLSSAHTPATPGTLLSRAAQPFLSHSIAKQRQRRAGHTIVGRLGRTRILAGGGHAFALFPSVRAVGGRS